MNHSKGRDQQSNRFRLKKSTKTPISDMDERDNSNQAALNSKKQAYSKPQYIAKTFKTELLDFNKPKGSIIYEWQVKNIQMLQAIYEPVVKEGGIVQLLSKGGWQAVTRQLRQKRDQIQCLGDQEILNIYLNHLIEFQFMSAGTPLNLEKGAIIEETLKYATFIPESNKAFLQNIDIQKDYLDQQIVVIRNAVKTLGMENVTLELINSQCGNESLELRLQNPLDFGFNPEELLNLSDSMTIGDYCQYQKHFQDPKYCKQKFGEKLKGGKVFFGVNFQPASPVIVDDLKQKLKNTLFGWSHSSDMLSYLQQHINGCTNPQFYLKVKGVWTGGHQQNVNMCAININHGPADSEWYSVPVEQVQKLRKLLKEKFNQDLYKQEGLWFEKINWFIENGIKITRIIQKAGDMVISGPGTLHWVRGFGVSMHSAWNIFPQGYKMLASAYHRQEQNQKIKFSKSNIIPLKTLTIKHIQHNYQNLSQDERYSLLIHLGKWLTSQQCRLESIQLHNQNPPLTISQKQLYEHEAYCKKCNQQILVYYLQSIETGILCLKCAAEGQVFKNNRQIYYKLNPKELFTFTLLAITNQLSKRNIKYCSREHIGKECIKNRLLKQKQLSQQKVLKVQEKAIQTQNIQLSLKRNADEELYISEENNRSAKRFLGNQENKLQEEQRRQTQRQQYENKATRNHFSSREKDQNYDKNHQSPIRFSRKDQNQKPFRSNQRQNNFQGHHKPSYNDQTYNRSYGRNQTNDYSNYDSRQHSKNKFAEKQVEKNSYDRNDNRNNGNYKDNRFETYNKNRQNVDYYSKNYYHEKNANKDTSYIPKSNYNRYNTYEKAQERKDSNHFSGKKKEEKYQKNAPLEEIENVNKSFESDISY